MSPQNNSDATLVSSTPINVSEAYNVILNEEVSDNSTSSVPNAMLTKPIVLQDYYFPMPRSGLDNEFYGEVLPNSNFEPQLAQEIEVTSDTKSCKKKMN